MAGRGSNEQGGTNAGGTASAAAGLDNSGGLSEVAGSATGGAGTGDGANGGAASGGTGPDNRAGAAGSGGSQSAADNAGAAGTVSAQGGATQTSSPTVWTNRNDNLRSAANLLETTLTPSNVDAAHFGLLFSRPVNGQIYAQPLYLSGLKLPNGQTHDTVFVATASNDVYAFDGNDAAAATPLWHKNLGPNASTAGFSCTDMNPEVGVTSTPVIDVQAGNLYVVSKGQESSTWVQRLHVLDVTTGNERPGSPIVISATVNGTGAGSVGGKLSFNARTALNRPGLLLEGGAVYLAFASHCDNGPYHGWVLGYRYDGTSLTQTRAYTVSPNGTQGGVWQAGVGLSSDGNSIYFASGNGSSNPNASPPDLSESVVRLGLSDFVPKDYWTPASYSSLNGADSDLSSGATLLPHDLLFTGSKDGQFYLLDRTNLGKFKVGTDAILQKLTTPGKSNGQRGHVHGGPVYYKDPASGDEWLLVWPESSPLMRYKLDPVARKLTGLVTASVGTPGHPGAMLSFSANGAAAKTAVLWATAATGANEDGAWHMTVPGTLFAVDPTTTPPSLLWTSDQNAADKLGNFAKFTPPTIANGHVYVPTFSGALRVYGLRN